VNVPARKRNRRRKRLTRRRLDSIAANHILCLYRCLDVCVYTCVCVCVCVHTIDVPVRKKNRRKTRLSDRSKKRRLMAESDMLSIFCMHW